MKTYIKSTVLALSLIFGGCAALDPLSILKEKPSLEVNANVGKNVKQEKSVVSVEQGATSQTADKISNDTSYTADTVNQITKNVPIEYLLIMVLLGGWCIPSPKETYNGTKWLITDILKSTIYNPTKGIANFILALFGREKL
jgi:hypothetical protein